MKIKDYFNNYKDRRYAFDVPIGKSKTIEDFYNNCIAKTLLDENIVLKWHNMLLEYLEREDAIFWIRYYESGKKINGRWNTRRGSLTRFSDGLSYAFVSNYDVHEIYNMISKRIVPTAAEFAQMLNNREYPLHYDKSKSCEEIDIAVFPNVGRVQAGVLTEANWYLAHIEEIKGPYIRSNGTYSKLDRTEKEILFPRGNTCDWDTTEGYNVRHLNYSLSAEQKAIVKAHFLRFVDPLNYFLVPSWKNETNTIYENKKKSIGEYKYLTLHVSKKFKSAYATAMEEFCRNALIKFESTAFNPDYGTYIIDIKYQPDFRKTALGIHSGLPKTTKIKKQIARSLSEFSKPSAGVGQFAKNTFFNLLNNEKLSSGQIEDLMDINYCRAKFGISYPVIVCIGSGTYNSIRYYKESILGKYLICSQWYERNRTYIENWLCSL